MKKLISLLLALVMVFSLTVPALAAEPIITGNSNTDKPTEGEVTATFDPNIEIKSISFTGETVTYDPDTNTYTAVIPAGEEAVDEVYCVIEGTNLKYIPADDETYQMKISYFAMGENLGDEIGSAGYIFNAEGTPWQYDEATGTFIAQLEAYITDYTLGYSFSNDGGLSWSDPVYITFKDAYRINVADTIANGTVYVGVDNSKTSAVEGETVELFVHAAEGYELQSLTVTYEDADGETQPVEVDPEKHTFVMPAYPVTVNATFVEAATAYTITVDDAIVGGTVTVNDNLTSAHEGDDITLTVTPAEGYKLVEVTVNDGSGSVTVHPVENEINQYTFTMPAADVTVTATFKEVYSISITEVGNGSVTADKYTAAAGEEVTLTITPDDGYALYELYINDPLVEVTGDTYTFEMPAEDVNITAVFIRTGKALETLYFKNTGGWEYIYAWFYTSSFSPVGGEAVYLTLVPGETDIYYTTTIPEFAYKVQIFYGDDGEPEMIDLPTDGTNQYNPDTETWTTFVATEHPTISANIVWGSMSFTYTDEKGWTNDATDGGTVTVTNTGDSAITATVEYNQAEGYEAISGYFAEESAIASAELATNVSKTFTLTLKGKPEKAMKESTKIGYVTVTIE